MLEQLRRRFLDLCSELGGKPRTSYGVSEGGLSEWTWIYDKPIEKKGIYPSWLELECIAERLPDTGKLIEFIKDLRRTSEEELETHIVASFVVPDESGKHIDSEIIVWSDYDILYQPLGFRTYLGLGLTKGYGYTSKEDIKRKEKIFNSLRDLVPPAWKSRCEYDWMKLGFSCSLIPREAGVSEQDINSLNPVLEEFKNIRELIRRIEYSP